MKYALLLIMFLCGCETCVQETGVSRHTYIVTQEPVFYYYDTYPRHNYMMFPGYYPRHHNFRHDNHRRDFDGRKPR